MIFFCCLVSFQHISHPEKKNNLTFLRILMFQLHTLFSLGILVGDNTGLPSSLYYYILTHPQEFRGSENRELQRGRIYKGFACVAWAKITMTLVPRYMWERCLLIIQLKSYD